MNSAARTPCVSMGHWCAMGTGTAEGERTSPRRTPIVMVTCSSLIIVPVFKYNTYLPLFNITFFDDIFQHFVHEKYLDLN